MSSDVDRRLLLLFTIIGIVLYTKAHVRLSYLDR